MGSVPFLVTSPVYEIFTLHGFSPEKKNLKNNQKSFFFTRLGYKWEKHLIFFPIFYRM